LVHSSSIKENGIKSRQKVGNEYLFLKKNWLANEVIWHAPKKPMIVSFWGGGERGFQDYLDFDLRSIQSWGSKK